MGHSDRQFLGLFPGFRMVHAAHMTFLMWPHARHVAALALLCSACQPPNDSPAKHTSASQQQPDAAPKAPPRLAAVGGAHAVGALAPAMILHTIDGETIDLAKLYGT